MGSNARASRVIVTGASGFLGQFVLNRLLAEGKYVVALSKHSPATQHPRLQYVSVSDLRAFKEWERHLAHTTAVVHLAGRAHHFDQAGEATDALYREANVGVTRVVYEAAARAGTVERFIYISSIKACGERSAQRPFEASDEPVPEDAYGRSKLEAERMLMNLAVNSHPKPVIIRPPLVFGPGARANFMLLMALADSPWPLPFGRFENKRSLVSAWNLADLIARCVDHPAAPSKLFLIADRPAISVAELVGMLRSALGRRRAIFSMPVPILRVLAACTGRSTQLSKALDSLEVNDSATRELLNWNPPLSLEEGIARTVAWLQATKAEFKGVRKWKD